MQSLQHILLLLLLCFPHALCVRCLTIALILMILEFNYMGVYLIFLDEIGNTSLFRVLGRYLNLLLSSVKAAMFIIQHSA
jgi:hypothetical protein